MYWDSEPICHGDEDKLIYPEGFSLHQIFMKQTILVAVKKALNKLSAVDLSNVK
ncbi:hypothetical protein D3C81_2106950 [compost metagenome]